MKRWHFSLILGVIYLAVFHLWMHVDRPVIIGSSLVATILSTALFLRAEHRKYFLNHWDRLFHAVVILDILLEGLLIRVHDHYGFYLCAIAFAIVVGGYRAWRLSKPKELQSGRTSR
ncbi:MAG: hypothetical protein L0Z50_38660 [Verrucomicrobiales bacterium]|nr:hypothetical protein [Verrucomicrobiales bacterium]